jgi:hypothetical protein
VIDEITREEALRAFASRNHFATWAEIKQDFDGLLAGGFLDFKRGPDGAWRAMLVERKAHQ